MLYDTCVWVHMHEYVGPRSMLDTFLDHSTFYILRQCFLLKPELAVWLVCLVACSGDSVSAFYTLGSQLHPFGFSIWILVLTLVRMHWAISPTPAFFLLRTIKLVHYPICLSNDTVFGILFLQFFIIIPCLMYCWERPSSHFVGCFFPLVIVPLLCRNHLISCN